MDDQGFEQLDVDLDRDVFLRSLLRELSGSLEQLVGLEEAEGYISLVGQAIGEQVHDTYRRALGREQLSTEDAAGVMVDLKRRIEGDFYLVEQDDEKIVLGNRACPFGEKVHGRPSMCMMTSNVFGFIGAQSAGYAKVELQETIAQGDAGCRVIVHLRPNDAPGREYFSEVAVPAPSRAS